MPDPLLYGKTLAITLVASLLFVLLLKRCLGRNSSTGDAIAEILGVACAAVVGLAILQIYPRLPPRNGLDRFLVIVLPAALGVELAATVSRLSGTPSAALRCLGSALFGWVLLYDSVHLQPGSAGGLGGATWVMLIASASGLFFEWEFLTRFVRRTGDLVAPLAVALATLCAGALIMIAGYLKGGAAAIALAAALAGGAWAARRRDRTKTSSGATGLGIVTLFGLLMIGRFFGGLSSTTAVVVFCSPLLAWLPESLAARVPSLRKRVLLRLVVVAIPLAVMLVRAAIELDRKMRG